MNSQQRYQVAAAADCSEATVRRWETNPESVFGSNRRRIELAVAQLDLKEPTKRATVRKARRS
jgi:DNA-binding LacI/PurR family transcriptional regulator